MLSPRLVPPNDTLGEQTVLAAALHRDNAAEPQASATPRASSLERPAVAESTIARQGDANAQADEPDVAAMGPSSLRQVKLEAASAASAGTASPRVGTSLRDAIRPEALRAGANSAAALAWLPAAPPPIVTRLPQQSASAGGRLTIQQQIALLFAKDQAWQQQVAQAGGGLHTGAQLGSGGGSATAAAAAGGLGSVPGTSPPNATPGSGGSGGAAAAAAGRFTADELQELDTLLKGGQGQSPHGMGGSPTWLMGITPGGPFSSSAGSMLLNMRGADSPSSALGGDGSGSAFSPLAPGSLPSMYHPMPNRGFGRPGAGAGPGPSFGGTPHVAGGSGGGSGGLGAGAGGAAASFGWQQQQQRHQQQHHQHQQDIHQGAFFPSDAGAGAGAQQVGTRTSSRRAAALSRRGGGAGAPTHGYGSRSRTRSRLGPQMPPEAGAGGEEDLGEEEEFEDDEPEAEEPSPKATGRGARASTRRTTLPRYPPAASAAAVNLLDDEALEDSIPEMSKSTANRSRSWGLDEDELVRSLVKDHGLRKWAFIASCLRTKTQKQVYARWRDYLQPGLTTRPWTKEEQKRLLELQAQIGNQWAELAKLMPGRSPNAIKNRFHATKRKLERHNRRLMTGGGGGAAGGGGAGAAAAAAAAADVWEEEEMEELEAEEGGGDPVDADASGAGGARKLGANDLMGPLPGGMMDSDDHAS